eukprot:Skav222591  [mRNA]  locus=scaffold2868:53799:80844:+ [translate_table: standard]
MGQGLQGLLPIDHLAGLIIFDISVKGGGMATYQVKGLLDTIGGLLWGPVLGNTVQYLELVDYHTATWNGNAFAYHGWSQSQVTMLILIQPLFIILMGVVPGFMPLKEYVDSRFSTPDEMARFKSVQWIIGYVLGMAIGPVYASIFNAKGETYFARAVRYIMYPYMKKTLHLMDELESKLKQLFQAVKKSDAPLDKETWEAAGLQKVLGKSIEEAHGPFHTIEGFRDFCRKESVGFSPAQCVFELQLHKKPLAVASFIKTRREISGSAGDGFVRGSALVRRCGIMTLLQRAAQAARLGVRQASTAVVASSQESFAQKSWRWLDITGFYTKWHSRRAWILDLDPIHRAATVAWIPRLLAAEQVPVHAIGMQMVAVRKSVAYQYVNGRKRDFAFHGGRWHDCKARMARVEKLHRFFNVASGVPLVGDRMQEVAKGGRDAEDDSKTEQRSQNEPPKKAEEAWARRAALITNVTDLDTWTSDDFCLLESALVPEIAQAEEPSKDEMLSAPFELFDARVNRADGDDPDADQLRVGSYPVPPEAKKKHKKKKGGGHGHAKGGRDAEDDSKTEQRSQNEPPKKAEEVGGVDRQKSSEAEEPSKDEMLSAPFELFDADAKLREEFQEAFESTSTPSGSKSKKPEKVLAGTDLLEELESLRSGTEALEARMAERLQARVNRADGDDPDADQLRVGSYPVPPEVGQK